MDLFKSKPKVTKLADVLEQQAYEKEMTEQAERIGKEKAKADADLIIHKVKSKNNMEKLKNPVSEKPFSNFRDYATEFKRNTEEYKKQKPMA